ncbi:MAG TPA: methyltransferase domain-containing protein [Terriglobales bacterium]
MQRKVIAELLDDDLGTPDEIAKSLVDLRHINNWFGGTRTTTWLLRRIAHESRKTKLSLLEIGAGRGDLPVQARDRLAAANIELQVTLVDRIPTHLPRNTVNSVAADALHLPFRDDSFDVVSCSLFVHHFEPNELPLLVNEALRVCSKAVLINDLIRSRVHLGLVYMGLPLFASPITWHDAPASVKRAYTLGEMESMLANLPAKRLEITRHYLYRMGVLLWK